MHSAVSCSVYLVFSCAGQFSAACFKYAQSVTNLRSGIHITDYICAYVCKLKQCSVCINFKNISQFNKSCRAGSTLSNPRYTQYFSKRNSIILKGRLTFYHIRYNTEADRRREGQDVLQRSLAGIELWCCRYRLHWTIGTRTSPPVIFFASISASAYYMWKYFTG